MFEPVQQQKNQSATTVQPKLEIGKEDDGYEKEADAVADKVMRMKEPAMESKMSDGNMLRRMADPNAATAGTMHTGNAVVQKMSTGSQSGMVAPPKVEQGIQSSKGKGQALQPQLQQELGSKMGADLSNVNIHTDSNAVQMSKDIGAKAFTHGNDIYFNQGQFNASSAQGKHLLAHELTHTIQQGAGGAGMVQKVDDKNKTMEALLGEKTMTDILSKPAPDKKDIEQLLNSEVGKRLLKDYNIAYTSSRTLYIGEPPKIVDLSGYYNVGIGERPPTTKSGYISSIKKKYGGKAEKEQLANFERDWAANEQNQKNIKRNLEPLKVNAHQGAALSFSIAMLELRQAYLSNKEYLPYIEPVKDNSGQTTWLDAEKLKAAYPNPVNDEMLFDMVAWNPDMPINAKSNLVSFVTGQQEYMYSDHNDPYGKGTFEEKSAAYEKLTVNDKFQETKKKLVGKEFQEQLQTKLKGLQGIIFPIICPNETEMPDQYLSAIGEGGSTRAIGGDVVIAKEFLDDKTKSGKSGVGAGYFAYDEQTDAKGRVTGRENSIGIEYPSTMVNDLEIYFLPYGIDTNPPVRDPMSSQPEETDKEKLNSYKVIVTIPFAEGPRSLTIYFNQNNRRGEMVADMALFPGLRYENNILILPRRGEYLDKIIECRSLATNSAYPPADNDVQDEVQLQISTNSKVQPFEEKEKEYTFPQPTEVNAASVFKPASFYINMKMLTDPNNEELYNNIKELAYSINDSDFNKIINGEMKNLDNIFHLTGGGVNPAINNKDNVPLTDNEIHRLENTADDEKFMKALNKTMGKKDEIKEGDLEKWRSVSGSKKFDDGVPAPETFKYKTQSELDKKNKQHTEQVEKMKYSIAITGYTDPQGTGKNSEKMDDFEEFYNDYITNNKDFKKLKGAPRDTFISNMSAIMGPDGASDRHNNNALSTLRALSFLKLLLIEKAKEMDRRGPGTDHLTKLITQYPNLSVTVTVPRVKEGDKEVTLIFTLNQVPSPVAK